MTQPHDTRIRAALDAFTEANAALAAQLEALTDEAAVRRPADGGWSPAQIGVHVAMVNEGFAGAISGASPRAIPAPEWFTEDEQAFARIPTRAQTSPQFEPPATATRGEALARLPSSGATFSGAVAGLTPERASAYCIEARIGLINLYQAAELMGRHTRRHNDQVKRAVASV